MRINPLRKFGLQKTIDRAKYIYSVIEFGDANEMLSKAKRFNRDMPKHGDRYFVLPVGGLLNNANLVYGRRVY